jgi:subtilase family serine protease
MHLEDAHRLLKTKFRYFHHLESDATALRAEGPMVVPASVARHIDFVGGANTPVHLYNQLHRTGKRHRAEASVVPASKSDPKPVLIRLLGGKGEIAIAFRTYCSDGQLSASSAGVPCVGSGNPVEEFQLVVVTEGHGERTVIIPNSVCAGAGGECETSVGMIRDYSSIRVKLQSKFKDGSLSGFTPLTYAVYATDFATPTFLKNLYGIPVSLRVQDRRSTQAVAEFLEQYYSQGDLNTYLEQMGLPWQNVTVLLGPNNETLGSLTGGESQLDIQVMMGVAAGADTWFWSLAGRNHHTHEEPFLAWVMQLSNYSDCPLVHSVSYGDDETEFTLHYINRLNVEFIKLGLRGVSILFASGDDGVATPRARKRPELCRISSPSFPSGSPYVIAVGGTQLTDSGTPVCARETHGLHMSCTSISETGCSAATGGVITSGGGFSNVFARPAYQRAAVDAYLRAPNVKLPQGKNFYNPLGRGYPDLAAYSNNYITIMGGELSMSSGTSASTPMVAAMFTFWNDIRLRNGLPPLGFTNPLFYRMAAEHPETFNDVVTGENKCMTYGAVCCAEGFHASAGWDPVTGLGSPRFLEIAALLVHPSNKFPYLNAAATAAASQHSLIFGGASGTSIFAAVVSLAALVVSVYVLVKSSRQQSSALNERTPLLAGK